MNSPRYQFENDVNVVREQIQAQDLERDLELRREAARRAAEELDCVCSEPWCRNQMNLGRSTNEPVHSEPQFD
jgi:hypothetical protein